jgi:hypothetical protein
LEDASRIVQNSLPAALNFTPRGRRSKKFEADFFFQILNLAGKRRLCHAQSA